ncbi:MAG: CsbD family protein [Rhizobacter sp.]|nr:CsbD family protein [Rhizobacter sp.]MBP6270489.1 CsbD family protein [Rhizobacter sp.]
MNKDQVKGRVEQAKGAAKEIAGKVTGNKELEIEGRIDKTAGKVQSGFGDAKEKLKDRIDKV